MTDSEEGDVDLPQQRKIRTSQHKALNRVMRTLTNLRDKDTPIILSLQILQEKETELATISRRLQRCNDYLVDDELDEELQGQDDTAFTVIETGIQEAKQLCQELIVFKTASCLSQEIEDSLQEVEDQKAANPEMDYSDWYPDIKKLIDEMAESLRGSTLASDHDLRRGIKQHKAKLGSVRATEAAPRRRDHKPVLDDKYKLNKITVPPFTGGLENWHSFWAKFKSAVHTQPGLSDEVKSIHLHDSIKDPSLEEYMRAASVNHVPYDAIIENLKQRYNKPRELHGIYCQKLVNLQPIKGTPSELSRAADTVFAAVTGLIAGGQSTINHIATSLVAPILPKQLRMEWETKTEKTEGVADVFEWIDFMRNKSSSVDHEQKQPQQTYSRAPKDSKPKEYQKSQKKYIKSEGRVHVATSQPAAEVESTPPKGRNQATKAAAHSCSVPCTLCSTLHYLFQCRQFQEMTVAQRKTHIQSSNICSNCLRPGHILANCQSTFRCRLCKLQHNTLLHTDTTTTTGTVHRVSQIFKNDVNPPKENKKMVMTSLVKLTGPTGKSMNVRAMLDSGAEVCLLSSRVMQQLQLKRSNEWMTVGGVEPRETPIPRPTTCITVTSLFREDWSRKVKVTVLPKVTPDIAQHSLKFLKDLPQVQGLPMADPFFYESKKVDLILDVEFLDNVLLPRTIKGLPGTPSAWKTQLGWGLMGGYNLDAISHCTVATVQISSQESETGRMDTLVERFWEIEDLPRGIPAHSAQEIAVQKHYQETHVFSPPAGRYMVSLPKRDTTLQLGESKSSALNRYFGIEQSMLKKGTWSQFQDVIQEYLDLGHAQLVTPQELCLPNHLCYYLPMHAVFKQSSTSTKLRVVFDASCASSSGASLNNILAPGPTLHPNLDIILIRFRSYRVALSADVGKMYREVMLDPEDRQLHRFLWRPHPNQPVKSYCMNRVTFGVTSSPYVAVRTLQQTAKDFSTEDSRASYHIHKSFYVDDLLAGADTAAEAAQLYHELRSILLKGGFQLKKWRSSSSEVLESIPLELQELLPQLDLVDHHTAGYPKTLGISWNCRSDVMAAQVQLPDCYVSTKRGIVSDTAKSFDVLGWMAPFIIRMKMLFQHLWKLKIDWDTPLDEDLTEQHVQWRNELSILSDITIPRSYFSAEPSTSVQLHGFSDASVKAYAAVVYIRATYADGSITNRLVVAKSKVAPLKTVSIPRLELLGAWMLSELLTTTRETLDIPEEDVHAWCDSTIALCWLRNDPSNYKTFVANRVAAAARNINPSVWLHVPTHQNPADCASRGLSAEELKNHQLWWEGPPWLKEDPILIPPQPQAADLDRHKGEEAKPMAVYVVKATLVSGWEHKFTSYKSMLHVTAYLFRFCRNLKARIKNQSTVTDATLTVEELQKAETYLFKQSQARTFGVEIGRLSAAKPAPMARNSSLKLVHPILNKEGILQVGGRLNKSSLTPLQKHPIILSSSDWMTKLVFKHYHELLLHCGPTLLLAHTAQMLYINGAKKLARVVCQNCLVCRRRAPRAQAQLMGQLPAVRVNPSLTFSHSGVDYAGPLLIKRGNPRSPTVTKAYLALFVCLVTKAVHIEVVSSQSTDALIAALHRFINRKGRPQHMFSDHGSNFVGAKSELRDWYNFLSLPSTDLSIKEALLSTRVTWHHIPERAPHFGGIWEAVVKSAKHHLKRIMGPVKLTFEEMTTITCQVEGCLNSRPYLAQDSHDSEGEVPLTPAHFLIGRPIQAYPEEPADTTLSPRNRWDLCKALVQRFWDSWSTTYLQSLQKRHKWHKPLPNIQPGDLVMVLDETKLQTVWKMAKVTATHPGEDGLVRTADVTVKTVELPSYCHNSKSNKKLDVKDLVVKTSNFRRPVVKLAPLMAVSPASLS